MTLPTTDYLWGFLLGLGIVAVAALVRRAVLGHW